MKLTDLFEKLESWLQEVNEFALYNEPYKGDCDRYYYLYCWVNLDTQWCYIGVHKSYNAYNEEGYLGTSGNQHYWNSRKVHEYKCIILGYYISDDDLRLAESELVSINFINKYSEKGIFNLNSGGKGSWISARKQLKILYPDTNGLPPNCTIMSQLIQMKKYNGDKMGAAHEGIKLKYPEGNGISPQCRVASRKACIRKYPDTNGISPKCLKASRLKLLELYPDTNGVPPENSKAWNLSGRSTYRKLHFNRALDSLLSMSSKIHSTYGIDFIFYNKESYNLFKEPESPAYQKTSIYRFFENCIEYNIDSNIMKNLVPLFRADWVPKSLWNLGGTNYFINTSKIFGRSNKNASPPYSLSFDILELIISNISEYLGKEFVLTEEIYDNHYIPMAPKFNPQDISNLLYNYINNDSMINSVANIIDHLPTNYVPKEFYYGGFK